jgi:hypothetical protein
MCGNDLLTTPPGMRAAGARFRVARPPELSIRFPVHAKVDRRGLLAAAVLGLAAVLAPRRSGAANRMKRVVLLGDSVFDNGAYVGTDPDVVHQLRQLLPEGWGADLNARDGAVMADIPAQMRSLPTDATHLVISVGGNDALLQAGVLDGVPARSRMLSTALPPCARASTGAMRRCWSMSFRAGFRRRSARSMTRAIRNVGSGKWRQPH